MTHNDVPSDDAVTTGQRIRALREAKRWSQPELAQRVGVSVQTVSRLETGKSELPHRSNLKRYAEVLGTTVDFLLTGEEPTLAVVREMGMEEFLRGHADIENPDDAEWFIKMWKLLRSSKRSVGGTTVYGRGEDAENER